MFKSFTKRFVSDPDEKNYCNYLKKNNIKVIEVMECPICMCDFEAEDKVKGLKCSKYHVYHEKCLQDLLSSGDGNCALCRVPIR